MVGKNEVKFEMAVHRTSAKIRSSLTAPAQVTAVARPEEAGALFAQDMFAIYNMVAVGLPNFLGDRITVPLAGYLAAI